MYNRKGSLHVKVCRSDFPAKKTKSAWLTTWAESLSEGKVEP